jgi:hypothetical protein
MDYDFYIRQIAQLEPELLAETLAFAESIPLDISRSYFNPRHPGFDSVTHKIVDSNYSTKGPGGRYVPMQIGDVNPVVLKLVRKVNHIFDPYCFTSYEINKLEPNGEILEHTDQTPTDTSNPYSVPYHHTVHIPLSGKGEYFFKRGYDEPYKSLEMAPGGMFSFNNYVLHKVKNSNQLRYNLIIHFIDREWVMKKKLYQHLGIKFSRF